MNDKVTKAKILTTMFACYGQANDGVRIASYVKMLDDVPADVLSVVCRKAILENKFLPTIAELLESVRSIAGSIDESKRVKTWNEVQKEIQRGITRTWYHGCLGEDVPDDLYGKSCEPKWSTDEVRQTVEAYGFDNLGRAKADDMPIVWSQLRKIYETICERKKEDTVNGYLLGNNHLIGSIKQIEG